MPNADDMKGRAKEAAGDLTDDDDLKREGKADQVTGKVKDAVDSARTRSRTSCTRTDPRRRDRPTGPVPPPRAAAVRRRRRRRPGR